MSSSRHDHLPRHSGQRREAVISSRRSKTARYAWLSVLGVLMLVASGLALTLRGGNLAASSSGSGAPMFGSSISSQGSLNSDTQEFGKMPIVRVYYPGLPSDNAWTTGRAEFNHSAVVVSFNASPASVLSGSDDSSLTHFFDTAPSGHPIYWSYIHEPEGHIKRGEFTVDQYKSAWAHVVSLANAAHNSDLHSTLILGSYVFSPHSGLLPWQDYLPGGNIISTLAWDAYPVGSAKNINPQLTPPSDFMAQCVAASKSVGLPYGFAEVGLSTPDGRPGWLQTVGDYLMKSGSLFATYFNGNAEYPTLQLTDSPSQQVWHGFVTQSGAPVAPAPPAPDVTVLVLDSDGTVVRQITRPGHAAGKVSLPYYGFNGTSHKRLAPGSYEVLVVASNSSGSSTATTTLKLDTP